MPPSRKVAAKRPGGGGRGRRMADPDELPEDFFLANEDDKNRPQDDADEEAQETAEEKRLRLARAYLEKMQAEFRSDEEGSSDADEEGGDRSRLTKRLKLDAAETTGRVQRKIAHKLVLPEFGEDGASRLSCSDVKKGHRLSATAVALSADDRFAITVSKDGSILKWDLATMSKTRLYRPGEQASSSGGPGLRGQPEASTTGPDWVRRNPRQGSKRGLYAVALSSDSKFLAVGGGDKKVHVFDALAGTFLQSFPGHRDAVSALAFRDGSHQLFSGSYDRTIKLWSLDDRAYMDTLFGHQAEVLSLDVMRTERAVSGGNDHSCRIWKVPEESQLVFRAPAMSTDCVRFISQGEAVSGGNDATLQVWNQLRKKPLSIVLKAHGVGSRELHGGPSAGCPCDTVPRATSASSQPLGVANGSPSQVPDVTGWVQAVAVCHNSDLVASGASDGTVRLWQVEKNKMGGAQDLRCIGGLPVRGSVNGLALSRSGKLLVAAVGQEPRLGRWMRDGAARNGLAVFRLEMRD